MDYLRRFCGFSHIDMSKWPGKSNLELKQNDHTQKNPNE